jgi:pimeloyl-ACP methyl ester carboxylesterase
VDLDFLIHNGRHCSIVEEETCADGDYWDLICTSCEDEYDWNREFEWMESTVSNGETIRGIDPTTITSLDFETEDGAGTLDAYFIPAHGENEALAQTTILYNHGNFAGIEHYLPRIQMLHEWGVNILVYDYRGYGKSTPDGHPSPDQFLADARLALSTLRESAPDPQKLIIYANSLGAIPAVEQAISAEEPPCALFMEAAWTSMRQNAQAFATTNLPGGFLSQGKFENDEKIKRYDGPVFYMHGSVDIKFTIEHVEENHNNAPGPKDLWILEGINHGISNGGVPEAGITEYYDKMFSFLNEKASSCLTTAE